MSEFQSGKKEVVLLVNRQVQACDFEKVKDLLRGLNREILQNVRFYYFNNGDWKAPGIGGEFCLGKVVNDIFAEGNEEN